MAYKHPCLIKPEPILEIVSREFKVDPALLLGRSHDQHISHARQVLYYLMREFSGGSFPAIAEALSRKDHTTVLYGCNLIEREMGQRPSFRNLIEKLKKEVEKKVKPGVRANTKVTFEIQEVRDGKGVRQFHVEIGPNAVMTPTVGQALEEVREYLSIVFGPDREESATGGAAR